MNDRYLDDYLPVIAIDVAVEEKTRVAEMATATLHKLHNVMQQMKNWRDDSARLKSNIWRMKMALRADDKNEDGNQKIDPLIAHQRAEISRLEQTNDVLGNEVASLKRALTRAEEDIARIADHEAGDETAENGCSDNKQRKRRSDEILRRKQQPEKETEGSRETRIVLRRLDDRLEEFAKGDRALEVILANVIGKVVETVVNLSEELVNVNEDLYRFKTKNGNLHRKLDRLRAMLRSRSGNSAEYRKRIDELKNLAERLMGEMGRLKMIRENVDRDESLDVPGVVMHVGRLMNDLKDNLKSEREAMIAAGDPDRLRYMKKVVDLKVSLKVLAVELRRSNSSSVHKRSLGGERCARTASLLNDFLKEIDTEIAKLKITSMDKYCRIGGISGSRYMTKVAELEDVVQNSAGLIAALRGRDPLETASIAEKATQELGDSIERLCRKIKDLEVLDDRASLRERIGRLEISIVRLRLQVAERNDRVDALNDECASVRLTLENERDKCEGIVAEVRRENECLREDASRQKQEISELSREHAHLERRAAEMQLMAVEIDALRKKLQVLRDDKETLSGKTERMRNILRERDKEIANIIAGRSSLKAALGAEVKDLRKKLEVVSGENIKLKSIIGGLGKRRRRRCQRLDKLKSSTSKSDEGRRQDNDEEDRAPDLRDELERLKAESNESKISLNEANRRIDRLERELDEAVSDRARLQAEVSDLKSNEQSLTYRSNDRTSPGEEAAREYERLTEANKALEGEVKHLRNEKEQLGSELSELRAEKALLARSTDDANNKCAALQDQVNKFKSERNGLREEVRVRETAAGNLKFELEKARTGLKDAAVEVARLRAESSSLAGDLDVLSAARSAEADDRVRVLLTEKNELTTRINELNDENAGLRDRLNKAQAENEYFSMELNKSRVENDEAKAKNALLQVTCDRRTSENEVLRRERDEARRRLNETGGSQRGTLGDRREIQQAEAARIAAAALCCENNDRESHSKRIDTRYLLAKGGEGRFADAHNKLRHKQDCSNAVRTAVKVEIAEQKDDETAFKAESDTCASSDNKAKIKDKPKGWLKRPRAENKALKLEWANLGPENADVAMELACAEDESKSPISSANAGVLGNEEIIDFVSKRRDLMNIRYTRRMSNYAGHSGDFKMLKDKEGSQVSDIDQLEVENRALKMEAYILRGGLDLSLADCERTKTDLAEAAEEIRSLKSELMNLRDEKAILRSRLEAFKKESDGLKSERTALKDELVASRKSNFDLRLKANDLRSAVEKLKGTNAKLEDGLWNALRETNERSATSEASDGSSGNIFRSISRAGENLRAITERLNRFECDLAKNSKPQSTEEDLQHVGE